MVESDTARVSALPVVGSEVPAVYFGKVALDSVGVRVGPSCLRLDSEETLPALLDERGVMSGADLGVTPDGGPIEGAPVLEPLEHSVLAKSPDGGPMEGAPVLEPLEHLVPEKTPDDGPMEGAPVLEPLEHLVPEKTLDGGHLEVMPDLDPLDSSVLITALDGRPMAGITVLEPLQQSVLDVDMDSLWMAPWDAGGTFRISSRPEIDIRRDILRCVVQLSRRPVFPAAGYLGYFGGLARICVNDLYAGVSTTPVEILVDDNQPDFPRLQFPPVGVEMWPSISVTLE